MKIGIIGLGVVGSAMKFGFERKQDHKIYGYDIKLPETSIENVFNKSEIIFVAVSTPLHKDGSCDVSNVLDVCKKLDKLAASSGKSIDVVIKSTIEPGTTERFIVMFPHLRFAICPEFLKEGAAIHDFCEQDICVIGTYFNGLFDKIVKAHGNLAKKYIKTTPTNAELVKYFTNAFNSTRVIFANLFYDLAQNLGADYNEVKSIATKRYNMIDYYLDCNPNLRGFGGSCLPKDLLALKTLAKKNKVNYEFLKGVINDNNKLNKKYPNAN